MNFTVILCKRQSFGQAKVFRRFLSAVAEEKIEIPKRIPRGPTDLLRALESTISRDPTAAHYKYHDDPYLIPMSNTSKRAYAMAQESGRKAAHWVRSEHPELFTHQECVPPIQPFFPKMVFKEDSEVTEGDLLAVIKNNQVSDAILVNQLLTKSGAEISAATKQSLLELLCYNNSEDVLDEEFIEERWFRQSSRLRERQRKTWKDGNAAEEVFISIENPTAEVYCAIIQGMAKYFQLERAYHLYEEAIQKGFVLNTDTYNSLIRGSSFLKENFELRWTFVVTMLQSMQQAGLRPNLGTLNATLHTLSTIGGKQTVKDLTLQTLKEFQALGIEPSLASWNYVLMIFCKERGPRSSILSDILNHLEDREFEIQDLNDTNFFVTAMDVSRNHLNSLSLGQKVHKLLLKGNNYNLIGDSYKESIYYRNYFALLLTNVTFEEFMDQTYYKLVPNIYVPEPVIMEEVLKQVELNGAITYIPKLWSDIIIFDQTQREKIINLLLYIAVSFPPEEGSELTEKFSNMAWDIFMSISESEDKQKFNKLTFTGDILGNIMVLTLRNDDFTKATEIMDKLDKGHSTIVGVPKIEALSLFVEHCIKNKAPSKAINCIQYASDCGFPEAVTLGAKLNNEVTLDETHLEKLSKIVNLKMQ